MAGLPLYEDPYITLWKQLWDKDTQDPQVRQTVFRQQTFPCPQPDPDDTTCMGESTTSETFHFLDLSTLSLKLKGKKELLLLRKEYQEAYRYLKDRDADRETGPPSFAVTGQPGIGGHGCSAFTDKRELMRGYH